MKKTLLLISTLYFIAVGCNAQGAKKIKAPCEKFSNTSTKFKDAYPNVLEADEVMINTWYHYVTSENTKGEYIVRIFFPETKHLTSIDTYSSKSALTKNGLSKKWYDDGKRQNEGFYRNGKKDGDWKYYSLNTDKISNSGKYVNDEKEGEWTYFHFEKEEISRIGKFVKGEKEGVWKNYDEEGRLKREDTFAMGIREGKFIVYDSLSNITNEGIYKADTIFQETNPTPRTNEKLDESIEKTPLEPIEKMPLFSVCSSSTNEKEEKACSDKLMLQYIYKNIRYPSVARNYSVEGSALIRFYIDKDGSVKDVTVLRGLCQSIAEECKRIVEEMPDWDQPGMQRGKKVKVFFNLPIRFRLE